MSDCREWYLIIPVTKKISQTHPPGTLKKGFRLDLAALDLHSGHVFHADRREAHLGRIHQRLAEVLFPAPERG